MCDLFKLYDKFQILTKMVSDDSKENVFKFNTYGMQQNFFVQNSTFVFIGIIKPANL